MDTKQPSSETKKEQPIELSKAEVDFFMGFFNAYRLIKETVNKVESLYYHNYSNTRKIDDIYNTIKAGYETLDSIQNQMFEALNERYGDRLEYDTESDTFYLKGDHVSS